MIWISLFLLFIGCTTNQHPEILTDPESPSVHTIRYHTEKQYEYSLFEKDFRKEAIRLCPSGYDILETTWAPTTLQETEHNPYYYNYVIDCPLDTKFEKDK